MPITKPTRGTPLTEAEAEQTARGPIWFGGPRAVKIRRGGQYRPRTGGDAPPKKKSKAGTGKARVLETYVPPIKRPRWARKYECPTV